MTGEMVITPARKCRYLHIGQASLLAALYMPFIRGGGLFIPTSDEMILGEQLFLLVRLLDDPEPFPVCAIVVWQTPGKTQGRHMAGVGVRFQSQDNKLRSRIESCLPEGTAGPVHSLTL